MTRASTLSTWLRAVVAALDASGVDGRALMREAGLDPALLAQSDARFPQAGSTRLWQLAVQATGDEAFGLRVAGQVRMTTFHSLGYTMVASPTLGAALERMERFFAIVADGFPLQLERTAQEWRLAFPCDPAGPQPAVAAVDAMMSTCLRTCRSLLGADFAPLRLALRRPEPGPQALQRFQTVLRAPLAFGQPQDELVVRAEDAARPLETANPELVAHNDLVALAYLERLDGASLLARVEAAITRQLPEGEPAQERVAQALALSTRSLQRRLADEGTTWQALLEATRQRLACQHLADVRFSVTEVAFLLGFSDASAFTRAFRRWTGQSPSAWRQAGRMSNATHTRGASAE